MKQNPLINNLLAAGFALLVAILVVACSEQNTATTLTVSDYPESDSPEAKLYLEKCGSCHAAPLPTIHPEKQWFGVVQRMQFRMTSKAIRPLTKQELDTIVGYLQKHAAKEK